MIKLLIALVFLPGLLCQLAFPLYRIPPSVDPNAKRSANGAVLLQGSLGTTGGFAIEVGIGSPPQYFQIQVATGNNDLRFVLKYFNRNSGLCCVCCFVFFVYCVSEWI